MSMATSDHPLGKFRIEPMLKKHGVLERVQRLINLHHENGIPSLPVGDVVIKDERLHLLASLHFYSRSFVILHEVGHYFHKHLDKHPNEKDEFEADQIALGLLLNFAYGEKDDLVIYKAIGGAFLAIQYLSFLQKRYRGDSPSHPSANRRMSALRENLNYVDSYYQIADGLTKGCEGLLRDLH